MHILYNAKRESMKDYKYLINTLSFMSLRHNHQFKIGANVQITI